MQKPRFYTRMHYFGDTYEERCVVGGRKCWKIPVMEGEYRIADGLRHGLLPRRRGRRGGPGGPHWFAAAMLA